jgi:hypothetical protein
MVAHATVAEIVVMMVVLLGLMLGMPVSDCPCPNERVRLLRELLVVWNCRYEMMPVPMLMVIPCPTDAGNAPGNAGKGMMPVPMLLMGHSPPSFFFSPTIYLPLLFHHLRERSLRSRCFLILPLILLLLL